MNKRTPHYEESPRHAAMLELRKGSRTSPHDTRPKRERTRADARRAAIRNSD
ncbi:MAG TPA: hypothetical protein VN764_06450 [Polyangiaceae bacterium]|nr:hypothetical protein [Polyangiaceae bacterium]